MSEQQIAPGPDEIARSAPAAGQLCSSLEHRRAGRPAQIVVTLGPMGTPDQHREALWIEAWGKPGRLPPPPPPPGDLSRHPGWGQIPMITTGTIRASWAEGCEPGCLLGLSVGWRDRRR